MKEFVIGFTGTRSGMSAYQKRLVYAFLQMVLETREMLREDGYGPAIGLHGDCVGADAEFDAICKELGLPTRCRPCNIEHQRAFTGADEVAPPEHPLDRNEKIVDDSIWMLAAPAQDQEQRRGGTWFTIRYARKKGWPIEVLRRDEDSNA